MALDRCSLAAFAALAGRCGVEPEAAGRLHERLVARHAEPHRRYHTLDHVDAVLGHLQVTAAMLRDRRTVELAAWYHDAVYDPRRTDNEAASAAWAAAELRAAACDEVVVGDVVRLVEVTAGHQAARPDEVALCDADLAVLGAGPAAYDRYRAAVREEYGFLDEDTWRAGRSSVLRSLLALPRLYGTPAFADREVQARHNVAAELRSLTG